MHSVGIISLREQPELSCPICLVFVFSDASHVMFTEIFRIQRSHLNGDCDSHHQLVDRSQGHLAEKESS